jgi:hypothetical protein
LLLKLLLLHHWLLLILKLLDRRGLNHLWLLEHLLLHLLLVHLLHRLLLLHLLLLVKLNLCAIPVRCPVRRQMDFASIFVHVRESPPVINALVYAEGRDFNFHPSNLGVACKFVIA